MDSITHAVLGAAIGESLFGKKIGHKAALIGAIVSSIPDFDVFLALFYDAYDMLSIHRGFSHSIFFNAILGIPLSLILWRIQKFRELKLSELLYFNYLCLFTHITLDSFTPYGTQLFLPFSDRRVGLDSINVVDPIFTLPVLVGLMLSLCVYKSNLKRSRYSHAGILLSAVYLIFTIIHKEYVNSQLTKKFNEEQIRYSSLLSIPVGVGNLNWYGVAKNQDSIFMIKYSSISKMDNNIAAFPIHENYLQLVDGNMAEKMRWFAKGFYTVDTLQHKVRVYNLQVDMRGITKLGDKQAPTAGYFEFENKNGAFIFSSGTIKND